MALRVVSNLEDSSLRRRKMGPQTEDNAVEGSELELQTLGPSGGSKTTVSASEVSESDIEFRGSDEATQIMIPSAHETTVLEPEETFWTITIQVFFPFLIAGLGMVGAGLVLDIVQHWKVFKVVTELFILVPALLGLKGNLEMTLASRLSTQANLGRMNTPAEKWSLIKTNLALIQCQAIVVGFLASLAAVVMGWIPDGVFDVYHALVLCASSVVTASLASLVLGCVMVVVIVLSHRYQINPDNVATPIAASLGDLITLGLLSAVATILYNAIGSSHWWISACIMAIYLALLPLFVYIAKGNEHTKVVLYTGWTPVLAAMMISSLGGLILDYTVSSYKGIAVFQPVINGVGGNLVAVQASRISTWLHRQGKPGRLPACTQTACLNPAAVFCVAGGHARTARVLLMLVVPGHLIFSLAINYLQAGHTSITPIFLVIYLLAASLQVLMLLYVGHVMILWMWKRRIDPDNSAIPYLTAFGDLLGTAFLAVAFHILYLIGDRDSDVGD